MYVPTEGLRVHRNISLLTARNDNEGGEREGAVEIYAFVSEGRKRCG